MRRHSHHKRMAFFVGGGTTAWVAQLLDQLPDDERADRLVVEVTVDVYEMETDETPPAELLANQGRQA